MRTYEITTVTLSLLDRVDLRIAPLEDQPTENEIDAASRSTMSKLGTEGWMPIGVCPVAVAMNTEGSDLGTYRLFYCRQTPARRTRKRVE